MPSAWGLRVTMEDKDGKTYTEYGSSHLRTRFDTASRTMTTKVEARTGERFCFRFQGDGPVPDFSDNDNPRSISSQLSMDHPPLQQRLNNPAPYALSIKIVIDGKEQNSATDVIDFTPSSPVMGAGKVIDGCPITIGFNDAGQELYTEHDWVFAEVGIELRLAQLGLFSTTGKEKSDDSVVLAEHGSDETDSIGGNLGTIEVQLFRVVLEPQHSDGPFPGSNAVGRQSHPAAEAERASSVADNIEPAEPGPNVTHTVEAVDRGEGARAWVMVDAYRIDRDRPYASFRFQYMSLSKLVKMGVANPDGSAILPGLRRARNRQLRLEASLDTTSQQLKRESIEKGDNAGVVTSTKTLKRAKDDDGRYGQGKQMVMPVRIKNVPKGRWLRSSQKENPPTAFLQLSFSSKTPDIETRQEHLEKRMAAISLNSLAGESNSSLGESIAQPEKRHPAINEVDGEDEVGSLTTT